MLNSGDEALCARVEQVFRQRPIVLLAPRPSLLVLLRSISCSLTETDEPWALRKKKNVSKNAGSQDGPLSQKGQKGGFR